MYGDEMKEQWRLTEYAGYEVSNLGRVKRLEKSMITLRGESRVYGEKILVASGNRYLHVGIREESRVTPLTVSIHRIVATAFSPNPGGKPQVNHIDGDIRNNKADNLEWCTSKENIAHALKMRGQWRGNGGVTARGADHYKSKGVLKAVNGRAARIYPSITAASRDNGISFTTLSLILRGLRHGEDIKPLEYMYV